MRTGGDDIAQALALMGAAAALGMDLGRVVGFEVMRAVAELGRPRVDVTFRISGFFRDAFPEQIDLIDRRRARRDGAGRARGGQSRRRPPPRPRRRR